jgi:hypothetical protein
MYKYTKLSPSAVQLRTNYHTQNSTKYVGAEHVDARLVVRRLSPPSVASSKMGNISECGAGRMSKGWDVGRHPAAAHDNRMGKETNDRRDACWEPIGFGRRALRSKRRVPP